MFWIWSWQKNSKFCRKHADQYIYNIYIFCICNRCCADIPQSLSPSLMLLLFTYYLYNLKHSSYSVLSITAITTLCLFIFFHLNSSIHLLFASLSLSLPLSRSIYVCLLLSPLLSFIAFDLYIYRLSNDSELLKSILSTVYRLQIAQLNCQKKREKNI